VYATNLDPHGRALHDAGQAQQTWDASAMMAQQTSMVTPQHSHYRREAWATPYTQTAATHAAHSMVPTAAVQSYDFRYRDSHPDWVDNTQEFYSDAQVSSALFFSVMYSLKLSWHFLVSTIRPATAASRIY
jgi:hypothetical protein